MTAATSPVLDVRPGDQDAIQQVEQWFLAWHTTGDPAIRDKIILAHLGLADRLAARFRRSQGVSYDDLVQAARVGLVTAVNRYDPSRANSFIVYAVVCVTGELRRCLRDTSWRVHVTRTLKEQALQVTRTRDTLNAILQRPPTTAEIGVELGLTEQRVADALQAIDTRLEFSLDQPVDQDATVTFGALLPAPTGEIEVDDVLALPALLADLPDLERRAVELRFFGDFKQEEIGAVLGYSQIHVSRLLRRALTRMRRQLCS
ncbi:MAG TPA: sigma-70 family RNA polymerase sigma factor [Actinomycetes bacterium]|jgi:RNA polymerase sigma-B factor|nr:sigma-70 family RNA polymerase sigma factor [Actinomycetes bacterium]